MLDWLKSVFGSAEAVPAQLPEYRDIIGYNGKWTIAYNRTLLDEIREITPRLLEKETGALGLKRINAVFCGPKGAGKSSIINSILSALAGREVLVAVSRPSTDHVSSKLEKIDYAAKVLGIPLCIWDMPGADYDCDATSYERLLRLVMKGQVPDGEQIFPIDEDALRRYDENAPASMLDQAHAVVMVRHVRDEGCTFTTAMKRLQKEVGATRPITCLLSQCDRLLRDHEDRKHIMSSEAVADTRAALSRHTGVELASIIPFVSNGGECFESVVVTELCLRLVQMLFANAEYSIRARLAAKGSSPSATTTSPTTVSLSAAACPPSAAVCPPAAAAAAAAAAACPPAAAARA